MFGSHFNESSTCEDNKISQLPRKGIKSNTFNSEFSETQRKKAVESFMNLKSELNDCINKIIREDSDLVQKILKINKETLKSLETYRRNLDRIILQILNWEQIDESLVNKPIRTLLALPSIDLSQFKAIFLPDWSKYRHDYENPEYLFTWKQSNFKEESKKFKSYSLNFVKGTKYVTTFDAKRVKVANSMFVAPKKLEDKAAKCLLPDGNLFLHTEDECFILYPFSYLRSIPAYKSSFLTGCAIYIDGFVYLFGRFPAKLNINDEKWSSISTAPFELGRYSTCAQFKNYILLTSWPSTSIIYYDISIDSYSELPLNGLAKKAKAIFVKNDKAFLLEFSNFIYESDESLMVWNKVGKCSEIPWITPLTSHSINYKGKFYFATSKKIYSFDFNEKTVHEELSLCFEIK